MKKLIFTLGIMGAGKSSYVKDKSPVVATDEIRKELFNDVDNISQEKFIFDTAIKRILEHFKNHDTVYLDATMVETKHRVAFLNEIIKNIPEVELEAVVFTVDPKIAKERIQKDIDSNVDRASSVHLVDEYHEYFQETMDLIKKGEILFKVIMK